MMSCGLGLVQRDREKALGWRDRSCCAASAAASPRWAGTVHAPEEGVSKGWAWSRVPVSSQMSAVSLPHLGAGLSACSPEAHKPPSLGIHVWWCG